MIIVVLCDDQSIQIVVVLTSHGPPNRSSCCLPITTMHIPSAPPSGGIVCGVASEPSVVWCPSAMCVPRWAPCVRCVAACPVTCLSVAAGGEATATSMSMISTFTTSVIVAQKRFYTRNKHP